MDNHDDLLLSVNIGENLIPNSLLSWTQDLGRAKLDLKVVEGWAIAIENGHIEVPKGSGSGFTPLNLFYPKLVPKPVQPKPILVWLRFENPKTVQA